MEANIFIGEPEGNQWKETNGGKPMEKDKWNAKQLMDQIWNDQTTIKNDKQTNKYNRWFSMAKSNGKQQPKVST